MSPTGTIALLKYVLEEAYRLYPGETDEAAGLRFAFVKGWEFAQAKKASVS